MSTNTYVALKTTTVSNTTTASVDLDVSSITGYTDLVVVATVGSDTAGGQVIRLRFNGDTLANYSRTYLSGSGSAPFSGRNTSITYMPIDAYSNVPNGTGLYEANIIQIMNYNQTNTYKTVLSRSNMATYGVDASVGLWSKSTKEAITTITLLTNTGYWSVGSTFTVYGIANADVGAYATGGVITQDANYYYHAFGTSSTFTPTRNLTADILVVAGGGGAGGGGASGGGGAGGLLALTSQSLTSGTGYSCTIGAGGAGGSGGSSGNWPHGTQGSNSQFAALTAAVGGGYGGGESTSNRSSGSGGSSGGASFVYPTSGSVGSATSGQGYSGATAAGDNATYIFLGGGGGAGGAAPTTSSTQRGLGGVGSSAYSSWLATTGTGVNVNGTYYIAGGGAGGTSDSYASAGGYGGGGNGGYTGATSGQNGLANTGGGGGGGVYPATPGGNGGSGLIIVRYAK